MSDLPRDFGFALRTFRRAPGFALAALMTLSLGIGATTAIFSTVNATLLRPLPYPGWRDLYSLRTRFTDGSLTSGLLAPIELVRLNGPTLRAAATVRIDRTLIRSDGTPVQAAVYGVTEGFFDLFRLPMTLGRSFARQENRVQGQPSIGVISHRLWRGVFGSDPALVGRTIRFADGSMTVIGVASPDFDMPSGADLWTNIGINPQSPAHSFEAYLRAPDGASPARVRAELASVMTGLAKDYPGPETNRAFVLRPLVDALVGDLGPILLVVLGATGLLLLLACVNVTNLLLARGAIRAREMALRAALGASRARLIRQLLTESLVLAIGGAIGGVLIAHAGVRLLLRFGASKLPRLESVPFNAPVLLFALAALVVSALLIGLTPALQLAATPVNTLMNEGGRGSSAGPRTRRLLSAMTVLEIATAVTLLAGAGWLVKSFLNLQNVNPGFKSDGRVVAELQLPFARFPDTGQLAAWSGDLYDRLRRVNGVSGVGATSSFPLRTDRDATPLVQFDGPNVRTDRPPVVSRLRIVSPGFFEAMSIPVVAGRGFTDDDREKTQPVALVNQVLARRYLNGADPLLVQMMFGFPAVSPQTRRPIVGVVGDVRYGSLTAEPEPAFYLVFRQSPLLRQSIVVSTSLADPMTVTGSLRAEIAKLDPQLPVEFEAVPALVASTIGRQRLGRDLMLLFGVLAMVLAAVGIYGVIACTSSHRSGEMATRLALGATPWDIFWLVVSYGRLLIAGGAVIGLGAAYAAGRMASSWLYEVQASDPMILIVALALVLAISLFATVIPARRAAGMDPARALRTE